VMLALVVQDALTAMLGMALAARAFRKHSGVSLRRPAVGRVRDVIRPMLSMVMQTNLIGYGRLVQAQGPALLLGLFRGPLEVGVFKIGMAGATAIGQLSTPAWNAVMPRLSRLWNDRDIGEIRRLIRESTPIALSVLLVAGAVVIGLRTDLLRLVGGEEAALASTVLTLGVIAQLITGTLFWNDSVLYAAGRAGDVTRIYLPSVAFAIALVIVLGREWGANGAAVALLIGTILSNAGLTAAALRVLRPEGSP
jgi:O-antigen/teichoic acid export membrane protein